MSLLKLHLLKQSVKNTSV